MRSITHALLAASIAVGLVAAPAVAKNGGKGRPHGAVFVATNHNNTTLTQLVHPDNVVPVDDLSDPEPANQIVMYRRANDGQLTYVDKFDTGGQGSGPGQRFAGDGLGSSHSVQLSPKGRWLFVTNAGSDTLSLFRVKKNRLKLTDVVPTGDGSISQRFPNSVTQHKNLVYVLNGAGNGSITGFWHRKRGELTPIPNSTRELEANQTRFAPDALLNPTQVSFTPDGKQLVVTIKDGNDDLGVPQTGQGRVLVFDVDNKGRPSQTFVQTNLDNLGPFGFSFDRKGNLLIALFIGGGSSPAFTSAAGSFEINANGTLTKITSPVEAGTEVDLCWLENNGRFAYGANYGTGTISSYTIGPDGSLTLLEAKAGLTDAATVSQGSTPLDLGVSPNGRFLYNVLPGNGAVAGWKIKHDGSLMKLGEFTQGLGKTVNGDHATYDFSPGNSPAGIAVF